MMSDADARQMLDKKKIDSIKQFSEKKISRIYVSKKAFEVEVYKQINSWIVYRMPFALRHGTLRTFHVTK